MYFKNAFFILEPLYINIRTAAYREFPYIFHTQFPLLLVSFISVVYLLKLIK